MTIVSWVLVGLVVYLAVMILLAKYLRWHRRRHTRRMP